MKKILIIVIVLVVVIAAVAVFLLMPKEAVRVYYTPGEAFVTNVLDSDHLIKVGFTLVITDDQTAELTTHNSHIRSTILNILRNQPLEVYQSGNMQEVVGTQIVNELNALFPVDEDAAEPLFLRADFNDFVLQ